MTYTYPKVTYSGPKVTYSDPKVTHSDPTHLPLPQTTNLTWVIKDGILSH